MSHRTFILKTCQYKSMPITPCNIVSSSINVFKTDEQFSQLATHHTSFFPRVVYEGQRQVSHSLILGRLANGIPHYTFTRTERFRRNTPQPKYILRSKYVRSLFDRGSVHQGYVFHVSSPAQGPTVYRSFLDKGIIPRYSLLGTAKQHSQGGIHWNTL